jgi:hypothetical protein
MMANVWSVRPPKAPTIVMAAAPRLIASRIASAPSVVDLAAGKALARDVGIGIAVIAGRGIKIAHPELWRQAKCPGMGNAAIGGDGARAFHLTAQARGRRYRSRQQDGKMG